MLLHKITHYNHRISRKIVYDLTAACDFTWPFVYAPHTSKQNNGDSHGINLHTKQRRIGHITVPTFDISFSPRCTVGIIARVSKAELFCCCKIRSLNMYEVIGAFTMFFFKSLGAVFYVVTFFKCLLYKCSYLGFNVLMLYMHGKLFPLKCLLQLLRSRYWTGDVHPSTNCTKTLLYTQCLPSMVKVKPFKRMVQSCYQIECI